MSKGWYNDNYQHALAARGMKLNNKRINTSNFNGYTSDIIRLKHIIKSLNSGDDIIYVPEAWEFSEDDDLTIVQTKGNKIYYYEQWIDYCWDNLRKKPKYRGLSKNEAIKKFVNERMSDIADFIGYDVVDYDYDDVIGIMKVEMEKKKDDRG